MVFTRKLWAFSSYAQIMLSDEVSEERTERLSVFFNNVSIFNKILPFPAKFAVLDCHGSNNIIPLTITVWNLMFTLLYKHYLK